MTRHRRNQVTKRHLGTDQREAVESFRRVLKSFDEGKASNLFEATRRRYGAYPQGDNVAQLVVQLHLKHVEMARDMAGAFRRMHFATAATLSRTLLEGGMTFMWAVAAGDGVDVGYDQLLRVLAKTYQEQARQAARGKADALDRFEQGIVDEAAARALPEMPDLAGRMRDIDQAWTDTGGEAYALTHYGHFSITSKFTHPSRFGPALFASTPAGIDVSPQGQTLIGAAALYYGAYYFCVGYQCSAMLVGLTSQAEWAAGRYGEMRPLLRGALDRELK